MMVHSDTPRVWTPAMRAAFWAYAVLAAAMMVPDGWVVAGQDDVGTDVREWNVHVFTANGSGPAVVPETVFVVDVPHAFRHVAGSSSLVVDIWAQHEGAGLETRRERYEAYVDGTLTGCGWTLNRPAGSTAVRETAVTLACEVPEFVAPGGHTFEFRRTAEAGGSPVVWHVVNAHLVQTEEVGQTMIDFGQIAWFLWGMYAVMTVSIRHVGFRFLVSIGGIFVAALPMDAGMRDALLALHAAFVLGVAVHAWWHK